MSIPLSDVTNSPSYKNAKRKLVSEKEVVADQPLKLAKKQDKVSKLYNLNHDYKTTLYYLEGIHCFTQAS